MTDAERNVSATTQGQPPRPAIDETPAARLARLAMSRRVRRADQLHEQRRSDERQQAEGEGGPDKAFGGPVPLDVVAPYLHRLGGGEIEPAIVVADRVARFRREEGFADFVRVLLAEYVEGPARLSLEV